MKILLKPASVLLLGMGLTIAGSALGQDAATVSSGTAFAASLKPASAAQVVNPSAVRSTAWGSSTDTPTSSPTNMGAFSTPTNNATFYTSAKTVGLSALGTQAVTDCSTHVPGTDPYKDQACAATNFLTNHCITPNSLQANILTNTGTPSGISGNCSGTYGASVTRFNYTNTVTPSDSVFANIANLRTTAASTTGTTCVTTPSSIPAYSSHTCTMSTDTQQYACSQFVNTSLATINSYTADMASGCDGYGSEDNLVTATNAVNAFHVCPDPDYSPQDCPLPLDPQFLSSSLNGVGNFYIYPSQTKYCTGATYIEQAGPGYAGNWGTISLGEAQQYCAQHTPSNMYLTMVRWYSTQYDSDYGSFACYYYGDRRPTCTNGGTLVDGICRNASTTNSTVNGTSCQVGDLSCTTTASSTVQILDNCSKTAPAGTPCKTVSQTTTWANQCAGYAASAGTALPAPN